MDSSTFQVGGDLGVVASVVHLIGYVVYNFHLAKSKNSANAASWAIWTIGTVINLFLYKELSHDWAKSALPLACSVGCLLTFAHLRMKNGLGVAEKFDLWILLLDSAIVFYWVVTSNNEASLLYQVSTVISFFPMVRGLLSGKEREHPLAWALWAVAYELMMITVIFRWEKWEDIVYPAVCFVLHLLVACIACVTPSARKS